MKGKKIFIKIGSLVVLIIIALIIMYIVFFGGSTRTKYYLSPPELNYYHGIIVDKNGNYINNAKIFDSNSNLYTYTNSNGYFELKGKTINVQLGSPLIVYKESFIIDTVQTYFFSPSDYKISEKYYFCRKEVDTIILTHE